MLRQVQRLAAMARGAGRRFSASRAASLPRTLGGHLNERAVGQRVRLCGWLASERHFGGVRFLVLRDRAGYVQCVANTGPAAELAVPLESVVEIEGVVSKRPESMINREMASGAVEVQVDALRLVNAAAERMPFLPFKRERVSEETRMRYRYLDLRRPELLRNLELRSRLTQSVRSLLCARGFIEVETPLLFKSTPEGAREFIVPTRQPGKFYALPQSPQQYKQLLMLAGVERYFQIARCFRDEDGRADRQPEFTQIDLEMSFVSAHDVQATVEAVVRESVADVLGLTLSPAFPRMRYAEALRRFGSDKPDTRFGMELADVTELVRRVPVFARRLVDLPPQLGSPCVAALNASGLAGALSQAQRSRLLVHDGVDLSNVVVAAPVGADGRLRAGLAQQLGGPAAEAALRDALAAQPGDLLLLAAGSVDRVLPLLGKVRLAARDAALALGLLAIDARRLDFLWVDDFPLFAWNAQHARYETVHHPFTAPVAADAAHVLTRPHAVRGQHYDLVLNGVELGGGSIRIHDQALQRAVLEDVLRLGPAAKHLDHLVSALGHGAPPHGGLALGLDRLVATLLGADMRDVIAFPKSAAGAELMTGSPGPVAAHRLAEYGVAVLPEPAAAAATAPDVE